MTDLLIIWESLLQFFLLRKIESDSLEKNSSSEYWKLKACLTLPSVFSLCDAGLKTKTITKNVFVWGPWGPSMDLTYLSSSTQCKAKMRYSVILQLYLFCQFEQQWESHLASRVKTSSDIWVRAEGVARDILTGEFWSDTRREGVSSLSGDSLLKVTKTESGVGSFSLYDSKKTFSWKLTAFHVLVGRGANADHPNINVERNANIIDTYITSLVSRALFVDLTRQGATPERSKCIRFEFLLINNFLDRTMQQQCFICSDTWNTFA